MYDGLEVAELVSRARFARSRIDVAGGRVRVAQPFSTTIELPTIDYAARNGKDYSVFYAASIADDPASTFYNQLARIDVTTGDTKIWRKSGHYPGEAVFVKNPSGEDPDDGVLLSVVLDTRASASYLAVLDAKTLSEHATVRLPHHIPFHFHGQFHGGRS